MGILVGSGRYSTVDDSTARPYFGRSGVDRVWCAWAFGPGTARLGGAEMAGALNGSLTNQAQSGALQ